YPGAILIQSGDWASYQDGSYWVTVVDTGYSDPEPALDQCRSWGLDRDHCLAKRLVKHGSPKDNRAYLDRRPPGSTRLPRTHSSLAICGHRTEVTASNFRDLWSPHRGGIAESIILPRRGDHKRSPQMTQPRPQQVRHAQPGSDTTQLDQA